MLKIEKGAKAPEDGIFTTKEELDKYVKDIVKTAFKMVSDDHE